RGERAMSVAERRGIAIPSSADAQPSCAEFFGLASARPGARQGGTRAHPNSRRPADRARIHPPPFFPRAPRHSPTQPPGTLALGRSRRYWTWRTMPSRLPQWTHGLNGSMPKKVMCQRGSEATLFPSDSERGGGLSNPPCPRVSERGVLGERGGIWWKVVEALVEELVERGIGVAPRVDCIDVSLASRWRSVVASLPPILEGGGAVVGWLVEGGGKGMMVAVSSPLASTILVRCLDAGPSVTIRILLAANSRVMASVSALLVIFAFLASGSAAKIAGA